MCEGLTFFYEINTGARIFRVKVLCYISNVNESLVDQSSVVGLAMNASHALSSEIGCIMQPGYIQETVAISVIDTILQNRINSSLCLVK